MTPTLVCCDSASRRPAQPGHAVCSRTGAVQMRLCSRAARGCCAPTGSRRAWTLRCDGGRWCLSAVGGVMAVSRVMRVMRVTRVEEGVVAGLWMRLFVEQKWQQSEVLRAAACNCLARSSGKRLAISPCYTVMPLLLFHGQKHLVRTTFEADSSSSSSSSILPAPSCVPLVGSSMLPGCPRLL